MRRRRRRPRIYELAPAVRPPGREGNFAEGLSTPLLESREGQGLLDENDGAVKATKSTKEWCEL